MGWKGRRVRVRDMVFGILGALMVAQGTFAVAQDPESLFTLTVRPYEMATATRTATAGKQTLDGQPIPLLNWEKAFEPKPAVYVPPQCVGTRRCPLVLLVNAPEFPYTQISKKYGMILAHLEGTHDTTTVDLLNHEMAEVLRTFAIDPDKIAIIGSCCWFGHRHTITRYAAYNPSVFSLVASATHEFGDPPAKTPTQRTAYFLTSGLLEQKANFWDVQRLRDRGYAVTFHVEFRGHSHEYEGYDFIGHWLQERWALPNPVSRPAPEVFGDPPLLTEEVLAKMTAFWTSFQDEPDSIKTTARQALIREVILPVGKEQVSSSMVNMRALADAYPSVAAAFRAAHLTPEQHEAYRVALVSARVYEITLQTGGRMGISADSVSRFLGIQPTSAVAKNLAFMAEYSGALKATYRTTFSKDKAAKLWTTP